MPYLDFKSLYDKEPETKIEGFDKEAVQGWNDIVEAIRKCLREKIGRILVVDCYPGTDKEELLSNLSEELQFSLVLDSDDVFYSGEVLTEMMKPFLTEDRVFGKMCYGVARDFIDGQKLAEFKNKVKESTGLVLVMGFCASYITDGDLRIYEDISRWEIQLRYRKGMPNFKQTNDDEDILRKFKRGFFVEWRIADREKKKILESTDFYLDGNEKGNPHMVSTKGFFAGLKKISQVPFRLVPYFDPGVWGGQWMKEVCGLDPSKKNYAWSFDGVPEENSIFLRYGKVRVQSPAMNLTMFYPRQFLGEKTFARFGAEFPIRFDLLDTMGGQNLSLQVHPLTEFIHQNFGMAYTQDESYYILDAEKDGGVYLGVKEGIDPKQMIADLEKAQHGGSPFPADKYVNRFPAKKHDHFLIPAGTIHCSSKNTMVLEISATPYIFTFKLWDWDRLGLDGRPRPVHIQNGKQVIQFNRDTKWVKDNLIDRFETVRKEPGMEEVKTGLHELEFIETHVVSSEKKVEFQDSGEFSILNLVEGQSAVVLSNEGKFDPFEVHYAETFILPAAAGPYNIKPGSGTKQFKVVKASVRF